MLRNITICFILVLNGIYSLSGFTADKSKPRARDIGIPFIGSTGEYNAITDVAGVEVGYTTIIKGEGKLKMGDGPVRTGVTAILPRGKTYDPVFAGYYSANGNGEMTGVAWIEESGFLEGPVTITNTHSVGTVRDAVTNWLVEHKHFTPIAKDIYWLLPVVAETYDGFLNDINGFHVKKEHVYNALNNAKNGPISEGNVGGGTGMMLHGFKGGTGTSSRIVSTKIGKYTVGVLVQANYGNRYNLTVSGVNVGRQLDKLIAGTNSPAPFNKSFGSIIVVVATDAPLLPHQLKRLARRVPFGIARTGGIASNGDGDIFIAFSTANKKAFNRKEATSVKLFPNDQIDSLFSATIRATEEAIINALIAAETLIGRDGNTLHAISHKNLINILKEFSVFNQKI